MALNPLIIPTISGVIRGRAHLKPSPVCSKCGSRSHTMTRKPWLCPDRMKYQKAYMKKWQKGIKVGKKKAYTRACCSCQVVKPLNADNFGSNKAKNGIKYFASQCRICNSNYQKEYRKQHGGQINVIRRARNKANPGRKLGVDRKRKYGIEPEFFDKLEKMQKGRCAICRKKFTGTPNLDHNHRTGQVRGILCGPCNRGLGLFKDSACLVLKASQYLLNFPAKGLVCSPK